MSSNLGLPFSEGEAASNARRNAVSVISAPGSTLAAIPSTQQIGLMKSLDTSGGLNLNEVYLKSADGLSILNVRRKHLHNLDVDEAGGLLHNAVVYNPRLFIYGIEGSNTLQRLYITKTGAASVIETVDSNGKYHQLNSTWNAGTSTGEYVNIAVVGGLTPVGFTEKMLGLITMYCDANVNQVARVGWGMEESENTIDTTRKVGMEMCNSTGTVWQGVTSNGVTRTVTATSMPVSPSLAFRTYRFFYDPLLAQVKISNTDGFLKVITSTIPSGGQIDSNRVFRAGIQTTNSTVKNMYVGHIYLVAKNVSSVWFDTPDQ